MRATSAMRAWWQGRVVPAIGLLILIGLATGSLALSSSSPSQQPRPEGPKAEQSSENVFTAFWKWTTDDPVAAYTAILTTFTGVLAYGTWRLVEDGKMHSRHALRAYIGIHDPQLLRVLNAGNVPQVRIFMKNSGQTPAYDLKAWHEVKINPEPRGGTFPEGTFGPSRRVLNPGDDFSTTITDETGPLTAEEGDALGTGTARFYAYGRIEFTDAFDRPQWFAYRLYFDREIGFLATAAEGNEAS